MREDGIGVVRGAEVTQPFRASPDDPVPSRRDQPTKADRGGTAIDAGAIDAGTGRGEVPRGYGVADQFHVRQDTPVSPPVVSASAVHMLVSQTTPTLRVTDALGSGVAAA